MQERLKEIPKKLLEIWKKYSKKQKAIIIGSASGVVVLLAVVIILLGRISYTQLASCDSTAMASKVVSLLKENNIACKLDGDNKTVLVDEKSYSDAIMLVSTSSITSSSFSIEDMLNTSISTTNGERLVRNNLRLQSELKETIEKIEGVESATVTYLVKDTATTILSSSKDTAASVGLVINSKFNNNSAKTIAVYVAAALGNESTDNIKVIDQMGNLLYDGPDDETVYATNDMLSMTNQISSAYIKSVRENLLKNGFTYVDVVPNLKLNFNQVKEYFEEMLPAEGQEQGLISEIHTTYSESKSGSGDIPGTDSNNETDYYISNSSGGSSTSESSDIYYTPSKKVTETIYEVGAVNKQESSIAITLVKSINRSEKDLKLLGLLNDMTYEEYKLRNSDYVKIVPDEELYTMVSMATGIPESNIKIITYECYNYVDAEAINWSTYIMIALAVVIIGFLVFVVFRSLAPVEVIELEPELSVEQLLATTKENQSLDDVEFSEKSDVRKLIEKFFDENPESVAQLLRNWLNEDWE